MELSTSQNRTMTATAQVATGFGRAHAKAILLGEHAVLHGSPALAVPVPRLGVTAVATRFPEPGATSVLLDGAVGAVPYPNEGLRQVADALTAGDGGWRIEVLLRCEIPAGRGLGSSAACARAAVLALADLLGRELDDRKLYELVQAAENVVHGRASGVDAITTGADSPLLFENGTAEQVRIGFDGLFVIADSGVAGQTKDAVRLVRNAFEQRPGTREQFVGTVSRLVRSAVRDLAEGNAAGFGRSMTECHAALRDIGVSTTLIDAMADAAVAAGALGAKVSGGGLGGCLVALVQRPEEAWWVSQAMCEASAVRTWTVGAGRFGRDER
ncbi:mevalonate kinase [Lentzea roselyniae]|uniref:mevalonate kinase n=1 Tax=Lentzea roselyniae TaxID=531940 RepID=A0ABP7C281_9PSEU